MVPPQPSSEPLCERSGVLRLDRLLQYPPTRLPFSGIAPTIHIRLAVVWCLLYSCTVRYVSPRLSRVAKETPKC